MGHASAPRRGRTSGAVQPDHDSLEQAAEWYALLLSGEATDETLACWQRWIDESYAHVEAWHYVEAVGRRFERLQLEGEPDAAAAALKAARRQRLSRRRTLKSLALLVAGAPLGWAAWRYTRLPILAVGLTADYSTSVGEIRGFTLADGTRLWLNTASALNADYRPSRRRLRLVAGEALIETAADPSRPFMVVTREGLLRALGTRFTVRQHDDFSSLAVYEGTVQIRAAGTGIMREIRGGERTDFTAESIDEPAADPARATWRNGILLADNMPLGTLIAELRRYRHGHLGVAPEVADLSVMGVYPLDDTEQVLAMLEDALPVRVSRPLPWWTTVEPRSPR